MLIKCPDCGTTVSNKASGCFKCGCPLRRQTKVQVISRTSKELKWALLKWFGLFLASLLLMTISLTTEVIVFAAVGGIAFFVSVFGMGFVKCQIWWEHE